MRAVLQPDNSSVKHRRLVLGGPGGMGKTQLAIAFATRHYGEDSSVFWLDASSEKALKDSFRSIAEAIFDAQDPSTLAGEQSIIHTKRWLSDRRNTQWLLILDNHDDPESYRVEKYFPDALHGSIIVTTRRPDLVAGRVIRLQPLKLVEEQLEILESRSGRKNVKSGKFADSS
jgi:DNA polymerase III delta prime subunit